MSEIQSIATNNYLLAAPIGSGYMETSALEYDGDKISGYAGSAFKAGDEFPQSATEAIETVTANSADWNGTTETVNTNSAAWGGSALPISAGPGINLELSGDILYIDVDSDYIVVTEETIGTYSVAGSDTQVTNTFTKAGYRPIAWTIKFSYAGVINFNQENTEITGNSLTIHGYAHTITGSVSSVTFKAIITWVRTVGGN